jgi:hypothetical protein
VLPSGCIVESINSLPQAKLIIYKNNMTPARKLETETKILCLYHEKVDCDCISSVVDKKTLRLRLEHFIRLSKLQLQFGINQVPAEVLEEKIEKSLLRMEKL